jgi:hypothetical protein
MPQLCCDPAYPVNILNEKLSADFGRGASWTYMKKLSPSPGSVVKFFSELSRLSLVYRY